MGGCECIRSSLTGCNSDAEEIIARTPNVDIISDDWSGSISGGVDL